MAKPVPAAKKKRKDDDDEDAAPKKKRRAAEPEPEEEDDDDADSDSDSDDDSDAGDDDDSDSDDDESEDEDSDDDGDDDDADADDDSESDSDDDDDSDGGEDDDGDDDEDTDDDDSDDDEDGDDDDDDEAPKKAAKGKASKKGGGISWDTDDAESGGLPEGRVVLLNPRTRLASTAQYDEDDPDGAPMLSFDCVPSGKGWEGEVEPFTIHLSAGSSARMIPNDDGTDFIPNPDAKKAAKGLNKSTNAFYFVKSLEDAGFPKKKIRLRGTPALDGLVVELTRVPQPARKFAADPEGARGDKTMPSVSEIYSLPWEDKGQKERDRARALFSKGRKSKNKGKTKGKVKTGSSKKGAAKGRPKGEAEDGSSKRATRTERLAEKAVLAVILSPEFKKKGLSIDRDLFPHTFQRVKQHKWRKEIMKIATDPRWYFHPNRPWKNNKSIGVLLPK